MSSRHRRNDDDEEEEEPDWNAMTDTKEEEDEKPSSETCRKDKEDNGGRVIVHIDVDCFYAQVETLKNPELRDRMVGVQQKNIVITTNYLARKSGVPKHGLVRQLTKDFPELVLVNGEDLKDYRRYSADIFDVIAGFGCPVERLGMDENFIDVTRLVDERLQKSEIQQQQPPCHVYPEEEAATVPAKLTVGAVIAKEIREALRDRVGITSSAGIAHNKLLAKLVGSRNKPDDQTILLPDRELDLMGSLKSVQSIPGIGHATAAILRDRGGIVRVADLQAVPLEQLAQLTDPESARRMRDLSLGIDPSEVRRSKKVQTIGLEDSFKNISTRDECRDKLKWLLGRLLQLVAEDGRAPQTLKVTIRRRESANYSRESRQCKIAPSLLKNEAQMLTAATRLLEKMVVGEDNSFHLTVIGVAVGDFVKEVSDAKSISAFFSPASTPAASSQKRKRDDDEEAAPLKTNVPADWDLDVFNSLPVEMQNELLQSSQAPPRQQQPSSSSAKQTKYNSGNSILRYFGKKS